VLASLRKNGTAQKRRSEIPAVTTDSKKRGGKGRIKGQSAREKEVHLSEGWIARCAWERGEQIGFEQRSYGQP